MYQVLARKYRPKNFHELLGQDHVAKALVNAINHQRLHHAYLFTGTRGVGKTTIARILAKCLNCETGITSEPCGTCSICQSIDTGRFIDLIEIDAASRTKVEDTRELLDNVPYAPTQGRYKVYLIDEVHMLSTHSFNALLKTLEEPPEHVKFLLATTDPQKLPITIISRCLQFVLRPLPQMQLADYLGKILQQEQIQYQPEALWQIATSAKGSVRDALSLTDQAIAFGNGHLQQQTVEQMLGLIDQADTIQLLILIFQQRTDELRQTMQQLRQKVVDSKMVFDGLAEVLHQVAILQLLPNFDLQINQQQQQQLQQLANILPAEMVQLYYEIVIQSREKIALANTPLQALEMCLLRLLAFKPLQQQQIVKTTVKQAPVIENSQTIETLQEVYNPIIDDFQAVESNQPNNNPVIENSQTIETLQEIYNPIIDDFQPVESIQPNNNPVIENSQTIETLQEIYNPIIDDFQAVEIVPPVEIVAETQNIEVNQPTTPATLLQPLPQDLNGEWTAEKWDYFVHLARENQWLDSDELAFARQGVMAGNIHGASEFFTTDNVFSQNITFIRFCEKIQQKLANIQISLNKIENYSQIAYQNPEYLKQQRHQQAEQLAKQQLSNSLVLQALLAQNASISSIKLR